MERMSLIDQLSSTGVTTLTEGQRLGQYQVVRLIAKGGIGAVYEAIQDEIHRRVAIKILHPDYVAKGYSIHRLFQEARAPSRINHPGIISATDLGYSPEGIPYLVMDFLDGKTLATRLQDLSNNEQSLTVIKALKFTSQIVDALTEAHNNGIIHRDIKPANIMIVEDRAIDGFERAKLIDWGIAKHTQDATVPRYETSHTQPMGTPHYMSPEQYNGAANVTEKTDVYSLGITLYKMLTNRLPYSENDMADVRFMRIRSPYFSTSYRDNKIPKSVEKLLHRMTEQQHTKRPTMREVATELARILASFHKRDLWLTRLSCFVLGIITGAIAASCALDKLNTVLFNHNRTASTSKQPELQSSVAIASDSRASSIGTSPSGADLGMSKNATDMKPPAMTQRVHWIIRSSPPGANVLNDQNRSLGITPLDIERDTGVGETTLRIKLDRYQDRVIHPSNERNENYDIKLIQVSTQQQSPILQKDESTIGSQKKLKPI